MFDDPIVKILSFGLLIYSIILHEIAHGWVALKCGDDTALRAGRLTLNPIPHIDPFGSILLPALCIFSGMGAFIGWAKPVPVNSYYYRSRVRDDILVSLAGVATNFAIAIACAIVLRSGAAAGVLPEIAAWVLFRTMLSNLYLMVFNLLPIPPLDGSHVMKYLLPEDARRQFEQVGMAGFIILYLLIQSDLYSAFNRTVIGALVSLLLGPGPS